VNATRTAQSRVNKSISQIVQTAAALGITPPARTRLALEQEPVSEADEFRELIAGRPH
jgi:phage terminase small subunit